MVNKQKVHVLWMLLILVVVSVAGCVSKIKKPAVKLTVEKNIVVVPFINYSDDQVINKFKDKTGSADEMLIEDYLTEALVDKLERKKFNKISVLPKLRQVKSYKLSLKSIEKDIPKDADVLILSRLFRFRERKGRNYAVSAPASVAFDIRLINVSDGKIINHYEYNETQKTLSENILNLDKFIKRKGRWVMASELADYGLDKGVDNITREPQE